MEIIMRIQAYLIWCINIDSKENGGMKSFSYQTKSSNCVYQWGECVYSAQSQKKQRILQESMLLKLDGWTLILRRMVELKAFLAKLKHQIMYTNEENVFIVSNHKKKKDYYENQVCPIWQVNIDLKENGGKKAFIAKLIHHNHVYL